MTGPKLKNRKVEASGQSKIIDAAALVRKNKEKWVNFNLTEVNDCVVRLGIFKGEFHWHKHDKEDELFFVLSGKLLLDLEGKTIELLPHQGYTVPRCVLHRTRAKRKAVVLMIEGKTVKSKGRSLDGGIDLSMPDQEYSPAEGSPSGRFQDPSYFIYPTFRL